MVIAAWWRSMPPATPRTETRSCACGKCAVAALAVSALAGKLMRADETFSAHPTDEASQAPRAGYKRDDAAMDRIVCQV
jgi:hypothetical protein